MTMMRLIVVCLTVLAIVALKECSKTWRVVLLIEDRHQARVYAEWVRTHPQPFGGLLIPTPTPSPAPKREGTAL